MRRIRTRVAFASSAATWLRGSVLAAFALLGTAAHAENHALILWIGDYGDANANLPGIENDARNARRIALAMGVPKSRITELQNQQLTLAGLSGAMRALAGRIQRDDRVFIYYSGHGTQEPSRGGSAKACSEGIVAQDRKVYYDQNLVDDLQALSAKASQVVMLNDSCFSGGDATRQLELARRNTRQVPKFLPSAAATGAPDEARRCGVATNSVQPLTRNLEVVPANGARLLYVAAAGENEVSFATDQGSPATQAWADCLESREADTDRSGSVSGAELQACAQARVDRMQTGRQTISITGSSALPVTLGLPVNAAAAAVTVDAPSALADLRAAADAAYRVVLRPKLPALKIGQDLLEFSVESNRAGYLYVLQVGSDGKTFNLLFPNRMDSNNRIAAGVQRLPHAGWRLRPDGPEGVSHLLALVSSVPKDFSGRMDASSGFAVAPAVVGVTRNLMIEAAGALGSGNGRYGASDVVPIRELR